METMHQERRGGVEQEEQQVEISTTHRPRKRRKKKLCDIPGCREKQTHAQYSTQEDAFY